MILLAAIGPRVVALFLLKGSLHPVVQRATGRPLYHNRGRGAFSGAKGVYRRQSAGCFEGVFFLRTRRIFFTSKRRRSVHCFVVLKIFLF